MPLFTLASSPGAIADEYESARTSLARAGARATVFDASVYDPAAVARLCLMLRIRTASEYHSASVFQRLATQLMQAHATLDAQAVMTRMAFDELRHAELCARALVAVGAPAECEIADHIPDLTDHPEVSREEAALRNVIYSCAMTEAINTARFVHTLDRTTDPYLHEVLRQLLADEVQHGAFGFHYVERWAPWLQQNPEVRASLEGFMRHAFFMLEWAMSGGKRPHVALTPDERALGLPDPLTLGDVFYQTVESAIVPGLERCGIAAERAYRTRVSPLRCLLSSFRPSGAPA